MLGSSGGNGRLIGQSAEESGRACKGPRLNPAGSESKVGTAPNGRDVPADPPPAGPAHRSANETHRPSCSADARGGTITAPSGLSSSQIDIAIIQAQPRSSMPPQRRGNLRDSRRVDIAIETRRHLTRLDHDRPQRTRTRRAVHLERGERRLRARFDTHRLGR